MTGPLGGAFGERQPDIRIRECKAMRTLRFHECGEPARVLRLEDAAVPDPGAG